MASEDEDRAPLSNMTHLFTNYSQGKGTYRDQGDTIILSVTGGNKDQALLQELFF